MVNSRELIRRLFQKKELPQVPFMPLVWSFAAKVRQATVKEMATNPALTATALSDAQKLFGYDAIITVFDPSLEAEALGCRVDWISEFQPPLVASHPLEEGKSIADLNADFLNKGRIPAVMETATRLNIVRGKEVAVIGVVTGPTTLGFHLQGDSFLLQLGKDAAEAKKTMNFAKKCCQDLIKSYCDISIDTIMVVEEMPSRGEEPARREMKAAYRAMWNVLRYFKGYSVLLAYGCTADNLELLCSLGADAVVVDGISEAVCLRDYAKTHDLCFAKALRTQDLLSSDSKAVRSKVRGTLESSYVNKGFFLTTDWEIPYDASIQMFHEVMKVIREFKPDAKTTP
jgi:uroporphyrinogen decarboxylase